MLICVIVQKQMALVSLKPYAQNNTHNSCTAKKAVGVDTYNVLNPHCLLCFQAFVWRLRQLQVLLSCAPK